MAAPDEHVKLQPEPTLAISMMTPEDTQQVAKALEGVPGVRETASRASTIKQLASVTLQNKEQMAWWRVIAVRALFVVALSAVVNFGLVLGALDMTKETEVKGGLLVADSAQAPVVQTAPSQVTLSLKYASVMDMRHLQHVDELMYTMASTGVEVAEKVVAVRKTKLIAKDEEVIPTTVFHTVLGNQLMVTPMKVLLIPGGDAITGKLVQMHLQGFTEDEIFEALSIDEEKGEHLIGTTVLCKNDALRCNRFFVEDAGLDSTALEAKLAEHSARRLDEEECDDEGAGRRLFGISCSVCEQYEAARDNWAKLAYVFPR